jgi:hypothetical protein
MHGKQRYQNDQTGPPMATTEANNSDLTRADILWKSADSFLRNQHPDRQPRPGAAYRFHRRAAESLRWP